MEAERGSLETGRTVICSGSSMDPLEAVAAAYPCC